MENKIEEQRELNTRYFEANRMHPTCKECKNWTIFSEELQHGTCSEKPSNMTFTHNYYCVKWEAKA